MFHFRSLNSRRPAINVENWKAFLPIRAGRRTAIKTIFENVHYGRKGLQFN
jgi:hypothetical protein